MRMPKPTKEDLSLAKMQVCREFQVERLPQNSEIIRHLKPAERERLLHLLKRKVVRTISGVAVVAVMTKPWECPHGKCAYCPGGPTYGAPQSYTGHEPAAMRGIQHQFDPYAQVRSRLEQLQSIGHDVDKVELILMGGTFPAMPIDYQEHFIQRCLDAVTGLDSASLYEAMKNAETSRIRNVGITAETRPDYAKEKQVDQMLKMGITRVELGVQNIYDDIYRIVERGHAVEDVVDATGILKDSGIKVCYHMMPGLPSSNFKRDLAAFRTIFTDSRFKPDMIKIYPCLVIKGTKTYDWWREGRYTPYTTEEAASLIVEVKKIVPPWVRIMRVQRDIPAHLIDAGVNKSNLRQLVSEKLKENGIACRCVRCREVGHRFLKDGIKPDLDKVKILTHKEDASNGTDLFISAEDPVNDVLIGYIRLRISSAEAHRPEIRSDKPSIVRELHVYGPVVPLGKRFLEAWQHQGYGAMLLTEAERISMEDYDRDKILVTSAIGTRRYYMRFGYKHEGPYVSKQLE